MSDSGPEIGEIFSDGRSLGRFTYRINPIPRFQYADSFGSTRSTLGAVGNREAYIMLGDRCQDFKIFYVESRILILVLADGTKAEFFFRDIAPAATIQINGLQE